MNVQQLLNLTNGRLAAMELPRLIDAELIPLLDNAYRQFVNMLGGVPDVEELEFDANEPDLELSTYVMRLKEVRQADGTRIKILNRGDETAAYASAQQDGLIHYILTGYKHGYVTAVNTPLVATTLYADIDRLPKKTLERATDIPSDISETWQNTLTDSVVAEIMQLSPNQNIRAQSKEFEARFKEAAFGAKRDKSLVKSKPVRAVRYGGI